MATLRKSVDVGKLDKQIVQLRVARARAVEEAARDYVEQWQMRVWSACTTSGRPNKTRLTRLIEEVSDALLLPGNLPVTNTARALMELIVLLADKNA